MGKQYYKDEIENKPNAHYAYKKALFLDDETTPVMQINPSMIQDYTYPMYIQKFLKLTATSLSIMPMENIYHLTPLYNKVERIICMIQGTQKIRMVAAGVFKQNMYAGVYEDIGPVETPINLFESDIKTIRKYTLMKPSDVFEANLEKGSCVYVPAYYWYQMEAKKDSMYMTFQYESSSRMVDMLIRGVDNGIVIEN